MATRLHRLLTISSTPPGNVLPASNFTPNVAKQNHGKPTDKYVYAPAAKAKREAESDEVPLVAPIKVYGQDDA